VALLAPTLVSPRQRRIAGDPHSTVEPCPQGVRRCSMVASSRCLRLPPSCADYQVGAHASEERRPRWTGPETRPVGTSERVPLSIGLGAMVLVRVRSVPLRGPSASSGSLLSGGGCPADLPKVGGAGAGHRIRADRHREATPARRSGDCLSVRRRTLGLSGPLKTATRRWRRCRSSRGRK